MTREDHQKRREILTKKVQCPKCKGKGYIDRVPGDSLGGFEYCDLCSPFGSQIGKVEFWKAAEYLLSR